MKFLTPLFILFFSIQAYSQTGSTADGHYSLSNVDKIPTFIDGEFGFIDYLTERFRVSQTIKNNTPTGVVSVLISFEVSDSGETSEVLVENCANAYIANEFKRICTNMDGWTPATLYNTPVNTRVYVPFSFIVESDQIQYNAVNAQLIAKNSEEKARGLKFVLGSLIAIPLVYWTGSLMVHAIKESN